MAKRRPGSVTRCSVWCQPIFSVTGGVVLPVGDEASGPARWRALPQVTQPGSGDWDANLGLSDGAGQADWVGFSGHTLPSLSTSGRGQKPEKTSSPGGIQVSSRKWPPTPGPVWGAPPKPTGESHHPGLPWVRPGEAALSDTPGGFSAQAGLSAARRS